VGLLEVKWVNAVKRPEIDITKTLYRNHVLKMFRQ